LRSRRTRYFISHKKTKNAQKEQKNDQKLLFLVIQIRFDPREITLRYLTGQAGFGDLASTFGVPESPYCYVRVIVRGEGRGQGEFRILSF